MTAAPTAKFLIHCRVSGGVTGTRTALLKRNGELATFDTRAEADEHAAYLNRRMNHAHSVADFEYTVVEP